MANPFDHPLAPIFVELEKGRSWVSLSDIFLDGATRKKPVISVFVSPLLAGISANQQIAGLGGGWMNIWYPQPSGNQTKISSFKIDSLLVNAPYKDALGKLVLTLTGAMPAGVTGPAVIYWPNVTVR